MNNSPALARGLELMRLPMGQLPVAAYFYMEHVCGRLGMCGEVMLTAYTAYANHVEKLECTEPEYAAGPDAAAWFKEFKLP